MVPALLDVSRVSSGKGLEVRRCDVDLQAILAELTNHLRSVSGERLIVKCKAWGRVQWERLQIFRLFKQYPWGVAPLKHKRWGIELTVVKGIVTAYGGEVLTRNTAQTGTTFTVGLPQNTRLSSPAHRSTPQAAAASDAQLS